MIIKTIIRWNTISESHEELTDSLLVIGQRRDLIPSLLRRDLICIVLLIKAFGADERVWVESLQFLIFFVSFFLILLFLSFLGCINSCVVLVKELGLRILAVFLLQLVKVCLCPS